MKRFIDVGSCPQFKNKEIEPQGHQNYSQVQHKVLSQDKNPPSEQWDQ